MKWTGCLVIHESSLLFFLFCKGQRNLEMILIQNQPGSWKGKKLRLGMQWKGVSNTLGLSDIFSKLLMRPLFRRSQYIEVILWRVISFSFRYTGAVKSSSSSQLVDDQVLIMSLSATVPPPALPNPPNLSGFKSRYVAENHLKFIDILLSVCNEKGCYCRYMGLGWYLSLIWWSSLYFVEVNSLRKYYWRVISFSFRHPGAANSSCSQDIDDQEVFHMSQSSTGCPPPSVSKPPSTFGLKSRYVAEKN